MFGLQFVIIAIPALAALSSIIMCISRKNKAQMMLNTIFLAAQIAFIAYMLYSNANYTILNMIHINAFSLFFMLLFALGIILVNIVAYEYNTDYASFSMLTNFALLGMYLVAASTSLLTIFIGLELASIPSIFIILLSRKSLESAAKFFIMMALAVALLSFAIVLTYGNSNTLSLVSMPSTELMLFAMLFFIAALGLDSSIFPFNILIPDVYQGAPAYITSMLGGINKKVGFAALIQVIILIFITYRSAFYVISILAILTMFYGNIVALMQKNFKRMLAYSSISQAGYMLIGIATATQEGITATLFQIAAHLFIFIGLLSIVAWLEKENRNEISDLIGLNGYNRVAAFALSLFMLSLVGLPFTTGFIGKFLIFLGAINSGLLILAILGIINSIISIYYYMRPIMAMYTRRREGSVTHEMPSAVSFVVILCLLITILLGVYPAPLIHLANMASSSLFSAIP